MSVQIHSWGSGGLSNSSSWDSFRSWCCVFSSVFFHPSSRFYARWRLPNGSPRRPAWWDGPVLIRVTSLPFPNGLWNVRRGMALYRAAGRYCHYEQHVTSRRTGHSPVDQIKKTNAPVTTERRHENPRNSHTVIASMIAFLFQVEQTTWTRSGSSLSSRQTWVCTGHLGGPARSPNCRFQNRCFCSMVVLLILQG